jgi:hypothetical protein
MNKLRLGKQRKPLICGHLDLKKGYDTLTAFRKFLSGRMTFLAPMKMKIFRDKMQQFIKMLVYI